MIKAITRRFGHVPAAPYGLPVAQTRSEPAAVREAGRAQDLMRDRKSIKRFSNEMGRNTPERRPKKDGALSHMLFMTSSSRERVHSRMVSMPSLPGSS